MALPEDRLPPITLPGTGPPPPRAWAERDPSAAARLVAARAALGAFAEARQVPVENLVAPETVRRLAWSPPQQRTVDALGEELAASGARPWQVQLAAPILAEAFDTAANPA